MLRKKLDFLIIIIMVFSILLAIFCFVGGYDSMAVTCILLTVLLLSSILITVKRLILRSFELFELGNIFFVVTVMHFGIRTLYDLGFGSEYIGLHIDFSVFNRTLAISMLGICLFIIGYEYLKIGRKLAARLPQFSDNWNLHMIIPVIVGCWLVGWIVRIVLIVRRAGSISAWVTADKDLMMRSAEGDTYLALLTYFILMAIVILFIDTRMRKRAHGYLLVFLMVLPEIAYGLISGSRAYLNSVFLCLAITHYFTSGRERVDNKKGIYLIIVCILIFIVSFPIISELRATGMGNPNTMENFFAKEEVLTAFSPWQS